MMPVEQWDTRTGVRCTPLGYFTRIFALICLCLAVFASQLSGKVDKARVLVDSFADPNYIEKKSTEDGLAPETYHLLKGKFVGGYIRDKTMRDVDFIEMAENLAEQLKTRNYYSAKSKEDGDFLIVVNWGVTEIQADFDELFPTDEEDEEEIEEGSEEDSFLSADIESYTREEGYSYRDQSNAALIGFDRALRRNDLSIQDGFELQDMLESERYFMILSAFDWQLLRKTGEKKLVWSTRFSMDAIKLGFDDAHYALSRGAANYFGTNLDGKLGKVNTYAGPGSVQTGELEVVETIEDVEE